MTRQCIYNVTTGRPVMIVNSVEEANAHDLEGCALAAVPEDFSDDRYDFSAGVFVLSLGKAKLARKAQATSHRDQVLNGGCPFAGKIIESDDNSRLLVAGSVSMAQLSKLAGQPFAIRWRTKDNSYLDLDADGMIGLGVSLGRFVGACYQASFAVKDAIDASSDPASVDITAGYP